MGQHSLGRLFRKMGEKKKTESLRGEGWPEGGVRRGDREPTGWPLQLWCVEREMSWLSLGSGLLRSLHVSRTIFHNSEEGKNTENASWEVTNGEARLLAQNHLIEYVTLDISWCFFSLRNGRITYFNISCLLLSSLLCVKWHNFIFHSPKIALKCVLFGFLAKRESSHNHTLYLCGYLCVCARRSWEWYLGFSLLRSHKDRY